MARAKKKSEEIEGTKETNSRKEKKNETKKRKETHLAISSKAKIGKRLLQNIFTKARSLKHTNKKSLTQNV